MCFIKKCKEDNIMKLLWEKIKKSFPKKKQHICDFSNQDYLNIEVYNRTRSSCLKAVKKALGI